MGVHAREKLNHRLVSREREYVAARIGQLLADAALVESRLQFEPVARGDVLVGPERFLDLLPVGETIFEKLNIYKTTMCIQF